MPTQIDRTTIAGYDIIMPWKKELSGVYEHMKDWLVNNPPQKGLALIYYPMIIYSVLNNEPRGSEVLYLAIS